MGAGPHSYALVVDGEWQANPSVPTTAFYNGTEVTWDYVEDCGVPGLKIAEATATAAGAANIRATFTRARSDAPLSAATARDRLGNELATRVGDGEITVSASALAQGKHTITITGRDTQGAQAQAVATLWVEPQPTTLADWSVYQIVIDRYRDAAGSALQPPSMASQRAGGKLEGVRKALLAGELDDYNAILLSPLYDNPEGLFPGNTDGRMYSSYHGYWPVAPRTVEPALGTEAELDALMRTAHERGIRVIFDVVPNHVHKEHPYAREHEGWFHADACVCGVSCAWGPACWFTPYLPDLDWRIDAVAAQNTADLIYWLDRFDADGIRIDAVPMMPRAATRRIARAIRSRFDHPGHETYLLGENFTDVNGAPLIRRDLGPDGLNGDFHFPLLWALRSSIAEETQPMAYIADVLATSDAEWKGSGSFMGLTIGNHDVARFASVSNSDIGDAWTPALEPTDPTVFAKQRMALGLVFSLPGVPVVYYGDEIALPGHLDVDARRVLPTSLTEAQLTTRSFVSRAAKLRRCSESLRRGATYVLSADNERLALQREADGADPVIIVIDRKPTSTLRLPSPFVEAFAPQRNPLTDVEPLNYSVRFFLPPGAKCL